MNYELALQLKGEGFPQKKPNEYVILSSGKGKIDGRATEVYLPTLEELVEACGEDFIGLRKNTDGTFASFAGNEKYPEGSCEKHGSTPTEAVARLWLKLNKK